MKKHRVLIPLDGSEFSRRIIPHIRRLLDPATHGRTGLRQLVLGSVAAQVLRRLPIPVLLVRPFDQEDELSSEPRPNHPIR
jgi:Universal stress protein family